MVNVIKEAGKGAQLLSILGTIFFSVIIWLMIYGNLSGNLGFGQTSNSYSDQTITLASATPAIPAGAVGKVNPSLSNIVMVNATGGETIQATNYTVSGAYITGVPNSLYNNTNVNVSYTIAYDEAGKVNTDQVINNATGGFLSFSNLANTLFIIVGIVLLISMLIGLLALVVMITRMYSQGKRNFSNY